MFLTVGIPTYEMKPNGAAFVDFSLGKLSTQTYKDFEVVISDHSQDDAVQKIAEKWSGVMKINYIRKTYKTDSPCSNLNNILVNAQGKYIKILFQDDFLYDDLSLQHTVDSIVAEKYPAWLVSACEHSTDGVTMIKPYYPVYHDKLHLGFNTISSPSVLTIRNDSDKVFFNENFKWFLDCIYYKDCSLRFGEPVVINTITVVNRWWENQLTNLIPNKERDKEALLAGILYDDVFAAYINILKSRLRKAVQRAIHSIKPKNK